MTLSTAVSGLNGSPIKLYVAKLLKTNSPYGEECNM